MKRTPSLGNALALVATNHAVVLVSDALNPLCEEDKHRAKDISKAKTRFQYDVLSARAARGTFFPYRSPIVLWMVKWKHR